MIKNKIQFFGEPNTSGSYILIIKLSEEIEIKFGRFKKGKPFLLKPGNYFYIGSALRKTLPSRLFRHTNRSNGKPAHSIQIELIQGLIEVGIYSKFPKIKAKKLHWHIDYLLDNPNISVSQINIFFGDLNIEGKIGNYIQNLSVVEVISKGLGASDHSGNSHLLKILDVNWFVSNEGKNLDRIFSKYKKQKKTVSSSG